ncbi:MAG: hypothetical protein NC489_08750 [Ruminococcus flavefaciens]|nr:hypothetical protein [Ruminococcus flavefaciens]
MDENKRNETTVTEEPDLTVDDSTKSESESGSSSDWPSVIGIGIIIVMVLAVMLYWIYLSGMDNGIDRVKLTKDKACTLIEEYFTPSEARILEYEINNLHYDLHQDTFGDTVRLIIHKDHYSRSNKSCEHEDDDIIIKFYCSFVDDEWEISGYTWPNRDVCECELCTCGEPRIV